MRGTALNRASGGDPTGIRREITLLAGLVLLVLALPPFFNFPLFSFWLLPPAAIYLFLLLVLPRLWLVVLPVATIIVNFTPWTGRFIYNQFDLLFLLTLASGLVYNRYRFKVYSPTPAVLVLGCYLMIIAVGYSGWLSHLLPPQTTWQNPYYTPEYAYKVGKGMLWGIALVPMWGYLLVNDKQRSVNWLLTGMTLAAVFLGLVVLWERGVLDGLSAGPYGEAGVSPLSDPGSAYRATALFAGMHRGGEIIDGVLLLLLPVTLYVTTWSKFAVHRLMGVAGFLALAYVALVGFTPGVSIAFVLGVALYAWLELTYRRTSGLPFPVSLKWLGICVLVIMPLAFATVGFRLNDRPHQATPDVDARTDHWTKVIKSARTGVWHRLVGSGVGSFPGRYIKAYPDEMASIGKLRVTEDERTQVLRIEGRNDLILGQRVKIEPYTAYKVTLRFRTDQTGMVAVSLCERNLWFVHNFTPPCVQGNINIEPGEGGNQVADVEISSGQIGARSVLSRWPTVLSLHFFGVEQKLEIQSIQVSGEESNVLLRNSSFKQGLDHWYVYDDLSQLPWHIKHLFLQVWFEAGWLGLGLFLCLLALLVHTTFKRHAVDSMAPVYLTGVITVCALGMFDSPLDSARVSWLFYFFLAAGLAELRAGTPGKRQVGLPATSRGRSWWHRAEIE